MFRSVFAVCCIYVALTLNLARALTDKEKEEINKQLENQIMECSKENPISDEDLATLKDKKTPAAGSNIGCYMACVLKTVGVMDDDGMLPKEVPAEIAESLFDDDEKLRKAHDFLDICSAVNSEAVTDDKKGCERAILAYQCLTTNASKFSIGI